MAEAIAIRYWSADRAGGTGSVAADCTAGQRVEGGGRSKEDGESSTRGDGRSSESEG